MTLFNLYQLLMNPQTNLNMEIEYSNEISDKQLMLLPPQIINKSHPFNNGSIHYPNYIPSPLHAMQKLRNSLEYPTFQIIDSQQKKRQILNELFIVFGLESDSNLRRVASEIIGKFGAEIINQNEKEWPSFKNNIAQLLQNNDTSISLSAYYILQSFIPCAAKYHREIVQILRFGLTHQSSERKLSILRCFAACIKMQQKNNSKNKLLKLPQDIYQIVRSLINTEYDLQGFNVLAQMVLDNTTFFKKTSFDLAVMLKQIFESSPKLQIKKKTSEIFQNIVSVFPTVFKKQMKLIKQWVQCAILQLTKINDKITQLWMNENEEVKDDDYQIEKICTHTIDYILDSVQSKEILPIISEITKQMFKKQDWRYSYAAIMILSQIGEYVNHSYDLTNETTTIIQFFKNENPKLRYAACHAIGLISEYTKPHFQNKFGNVIFPQLVYLLKNDPVPKVVTHVAAALTNFMEGMQFQQVEEHMHQVVHLLLDLIVNGIHLGKTGALNALSSLAEISKEHLSPYLDECFHVLFSIFTLSSSSYPSLNNLWQLKLMGIQTLTSIAQPVGAALFRPQLPRVVQIISDIQASIISTFKEQSTSISYATSISYVLDSWRRLCLAYGQQLTPYIKDTFPQLIAIFQGLMVQLKLKNNSAEQGDNVDDDDDEQIKQRITYILEDIFNIFKQSFEYAEITLVFLGNLIEESTHQNNKKNISNCITTLIGIVDIKDKDLLASIIKQLVVQSLQQIKGQERWAVILNYSDILASIFGIQSLFTSQEIKYLIDQWIHMLANIHQKIKGTNNQDEFENDVDAQDEDEDEQSDRNDQIQQMAQVQVTTSHLFEKLIKSNIPTALQIVHYLIYDIFPIIFIEVQTQNKLMFGISLINTLIEISDYNQLGNHWESFARVLLHYSTSSNNYIREDACRGIGFLIEKTPQYLMNQTVIKNWLDSLGTALNIKDSNDKVKSYLHCQDIIYASLGRIIKAHSRLFDLKRYFEDWLNHLPLRHAKNESNAQIQFLIDTIMIHKEIMLGNNEVANFKKLLTIYWGVTVRRYYQQSTKAKVRVHINCLQFDALVNQSLKTAWNEIAGRRQNIINFMA